ncbi:hypothetical protein PW52_04925 [Tamlana sedimentorum]|uniref:C-type lysozyme inhibitor domain-containing protein n=1 Tax=Neotamlana sedimentorum TaxID=1435349 RepID=A0A0D7WFH4_9FLAO|nr:hypothetical protein [Tamlana sedimentorum]KJD36497.1 hypothetical protein PW52_04925 [Tamlana sedimentorum]
MTKKLPFCAFITCLIFNASVSQTNVPRIPADDSWSIYIDTQEGVSTDFNISIATGIEQKLDLVLPDTKTTYINHIRASDDNDGGYQLKTTGGCWYIIKNGIILSKSTGAYVVCLRTD